jgi:16S rRNA G966 N2-methylase RsmD
VAAAAKAMAMDEVTREARLPIEPRDAMKWKGPWRSFRLIFADPPYAFWLQTPKAIIVRGLDYLAEDDPRARLVCEAPGGFELIAPRGLRIVKKIARGPRQPAVTIFARDEDAESGAR